MLSGDPDTDRAKLEQYKSSLRSLIKEFRSIFPSLCEGEELTGEQVIGIINAVSYFQDTDTQKKLDKFEERISQILQKINYQSSEGDHSFLDECRERETDLNRALNALNDDSHIHFIVGITLGGGTAGIVKLLVDEIKRLRPDQRITVTLIGSNDLLEQFHLLKDTFNDVEFIQANRKELVTTYEDSLVVGVQLNEECYVLGHIDINFRILPNEQNVNLNTSNYMGVTQNLFHPYGALPLNAGLFDRHTKRDSLSPDTLHTHRLAWLTENVPEAFFETLREHGTNRIFDETRCAWSLAYFQDSEIMLSEFESVCTFLKRVDKDFLDKIGSRVLYFMIPGKYIYASFSLDDLVQKGVSVITKEKIMEPQKGNRAPVTVLLLDSLTREAVLNLNIELGGTLKKVNESFIEWPRIVTGNASWLECVSAGVPCVHDTYDSGLGGIEQTLSLLVDRFNVLTEQNITEDRFIAGRNDPLDVYGNLENTTKLAREFSVACQKANLAHDILRALAKKQA